jgi:hypothetical protein
MSASIWPPHVMEHYDQEIHGRFVAKEEVASYQRKLHGSQEPESQRQVDNDNHCQDEQQAKQAATSPSGQRQDQSRAAVFRVRSGPVGHRSASQPIADRLTSAARPTRSQSHQSYQQSSNNHQLELNKAIT